MIGLGKNRPGSFPRENTFILSACFSSDCAALGGFNGRDVSQTAKHSALDRLPHSPWLLRRHLAPTSPAPPHLAELCPLTRRIIRLARRGCCRLTPFGGSPGRRRWAPASPTPHPSTPTREPASRPPGGAQRLHSSPPQQPPSALPVIGRPPRVLRSDWPPPRQSRTPGRAEVTLGC